VLLTFITVNGSGGDVADVIVDGKLLMRDHELLHLDEEKIMDCAQQWSDEFLTYYLAKVEAGEPLVEQLHEEFQP
jgi:hypothetical protein